ncbi:hypothetical protein ABFS83_06G144800 [Erythranthe nasuta]
MEKRREDKKGKPLIPARSCNDTTTTEKFVLCVQVIMLPVTYACSWKKTSGFTQTVKNFF